LHLEFPGYIENEVGQVITFVSRLFITDKKQEVLFIGRIVPVVELAFGELRGLDHVVLDHHADGIEKGEGLDLTYLLGAQLLPEVTRHYKRQVTDTGPCRNQVTGASARLFAKIDQLFHRYFAATEMVGQ